MSDEPQGEQWWLASDGKWYPPHLHPWLSPPGPPPPPGETRFEEPGGAPTPTPSSAGQPPPAGYPGAGPWQEPWPGAPGAGPLPPGGGASRSFLLDPQLHLPLAHWWKRVVALLIDGLVIGAGAMVQIIIAEAVLNAALQRAGGTRGTGAGVVMGVLWCVVIVASAVYYAALNGGHRGQTVGKRALSIATRDARSGGPIGFWRALGRYLVTIVFMVLAYVPYIIDSLAPLWDVRRQSLHDKVARSVVVDLKP